MFCRSLWTRRLVRIQQHQVEWQSNRVLVFAAHAGRREDDPFNQPFGEAADALRQLPTKCSQLPHVVFQLGAQAARLHGQRCDCLFARSQKGRSGRRHADLHGHNAAARRFGFAGGLRRRGAAAILGQLGLPGLLGLRRRHAWLYGLTRRGAAAFLACGHRTASAAGKQVRRSGNSVRRVHLGPR